MSRKPGTVRIIAGQWRGRRLPVPDLDGLRPSGDRGRETLFNWLQPYLQGARVADLFAGTGVLGLEAISRGAASAVLVDASHAAAAAIRNSIEVLGARQAEVVESDAIAWLKTQPAASIDIAFVDPPFSTLLAEHAMSALAQSDCLVGGGLLYLETARAEAALPLGRSWESVREKTLAEVRMQLLRKPIKI